VQQLGKYEVIRRLASGGMGDIFLARQSGAGGLERYAIIKTLHAELAAQRKFVDQFLDEARVVATVNHPGVVAIYDIEQVDGLYYLAMEYIHGVSLAQLRGASAVDERPVPLAVAAQVVRDAAVALDHVHHARTAAGDPACIVHRDVSPQNIMVREDGITKVVDFGIAMAAERLTRTETGELKGKYSYMAPEQVEGAPVDARADQFSLGVVLWELCAGRQLFKGDRPSEIFSLITGAPPPLLSEVRAEVPPALAEIARRMLSRAPTQRFARCQDVADALDRFIGELGEPAGERGVARFVQEVAGHLLEDRTREATDAERLSLLQPPSQAATAPMRRSAPRAPEQQQQPALQTSLFTLAQPGKRGSLVMALLVALSAVAVGLFLYFQPFADPPAVLTDPASELNPSVWVERIEQTRETEQVARTAVAVLPFELLDPDPRYEALGQGAVERVEAYLVESSRLELVSREALEEQMARHGLDLDQAVDAKVACQLADDAGARYLVMGSAQVIGTSTLVLGAKVYSVVSGELMAHINPPRASLSALALAYDDMARQVYQRLIDLVAPEDAGASPGD